MESILSINETSADLLGGNNLTSIDTYSSLANPDGNNSITQQQSANGSTYPSTDVINQAVLNEQTVLGLNWFQQSGEYAATAYQAYNAAKYAFDQAIATGAVNPAVVVDIDETVLDNSAYNAGLVDTNNAFSNNTWYQWILAEQAQAIPGSVDFINYVNSNGGKVFFISDRDESSTNNSNNNDLELATIDNLLKLGFTSVSDETLLLRGEFTQVVDGRVDTSKQPRREAVENGSADGITHQTVVLVGDNLNDLTNQAGTSNSDRRAYVDANQQRFGVYNPGEPAYIALPNPIYGAWEGPGLYNPAEFGKQQWTQLTASEKYEQRKEALIRWLPGLEEPITGITEILTDSEGNNVFVAVKDGTTTLIKDIDNTLVDYFTGAPVSGFAVV